MYGYLRDLTLHESTADKVAYRGYYCGMCCAVTRVLGGSKILLNNRDIVGFAIFLKLNRGQTCTAKTCYYLTRRGRSAYSGEWKKMVMLAVAIRYAKALDDRHDGQDRRAERIMRTVQKPLAEFEKLLPGFTDTVDEIMAEFFEKESKCKGVIEQGDVFADAVLRMILLLFDVEDKRTLEQIRALMIWYCLCDALDDYKKDSCGGTYNPLFSIAWRPSLADFSDTERAKLEKTVQRVKDRMKALAPCPIEDKEDEMIDYYFNVWCPGTLDRLMGL